ncbi:hypothetical protein ACIP88_27315 [Streptomyces uncialis]|uniref:hypothetical protein n=1 Tax=Streptomyces uncialis TaxID=1048205 RepID=UPI0037F240EB
MIQIALKAVGDWCAKRADGRRRDTPGPAAWRRVSGRQVPGRAERQTLGQTVRRGPRVVALDGTTMTVPDTPAVMTTGPP